MANRINLYFASGDPDVAYLAVGTDRADGFSFPLNRDTPRIANPDPELARGCKGLSFTSFERTGKEQLTL